MEFWAGILGVVIGAVGQYLIEAARFKRETKERRAIDDKRKTMLRDALTNRPGTAEWRKLQTLSRIIGADYETTTRLLIEIGARGSEGESEVWALESEKPLGQKAI